ncbi:MAG: glycosyltransferase [Deltaproteobacteria bacterium]|nr:glycosyltransferase [Deltaproteobacteria bacterium]
MRRVLLVAYYFPPLGGGGAGRPLKLARYLPASGWAVDVLTVRGGIWSAVDESPLAELPPAVTVHRAPIIIPGRLWGSFRRQGTGGAAVTQDRSAGEGGGVLEGMKELLRKGLYIPDEFIGWYPFAVRLGARLVRERAIEAVVSTSPPHTAHLVGRAIAAKTGVPFVADFRDAWTRNPSFRRGEGRRGRIERRLEAGIAGAARRIVTVSQGIRNGLLQDHPLLRPEDVRVIQNGFDPEDFVKGSLPSDLAPIPGKLRIVYTGGWLDGRTPETFLAALRAYAGKSRRQGLPEIEAVFAGTEQAAVARCAARAGVSALVRTVGYLPLRTACALQRSADALLLTLSDRKHGEGILTGKIFQYLGAGRPVLAVVPEGEAADLVRKTGAGCVVAPGDTEDVCRALTSLAGSKRAGRPLRGADAQAAAPYTRQAASRRFASLLDEVCRG